MYPLLRVANCNVYLQRSVIMATTTTANVSGTAATNSGGSGLAGEAAKLLDFNQKVDISLLDNIIGCMYNGSGEQVSIQYSSISIVTCLRMLYITTPKSGCSSVFGEAVGYSCA